MIRFNDGTYGNFVVYPDHKRPGQHYVYRPVGKKLRRTYVALSGVCGEWRETYRR